MGGGIYCCSREEIRLQKNPTIKDIFLDELINSNRNPKSPERKKSVKIYDNSKLIKIQKIFRSFSTRKKIKKIILGNRFSPSNIPGKEITEAEFYNYSKLFEEIEKNLSPYEKSKKENFTKLSKFNTDAKLNTETDLKILSEEKSQISSPNDNYNNTNNNSLFTTNMKFDNVLSEEKNTYNNIPLKLFRILYRDNSIYSGYYNYKWQKHGLGSLITNDRKKITGIFQEDEIKGFCRKISSEGDIYEGNFDGYTFSGYGEFTSADGIKYKGTFIKGLKEGNGEEITPEMNTYVGSFKNGMKTGQGKLYWIDGTQYSGDFKNNQIEGIGKMNFLNKSIYIGDWVDNKIEGMGIYFWENNMVYLGEYKNEKKWGFGIFIWPNGYKYEGEWINGIQHGFGIFYAEGESQFSEWRLGVKIPGISIGDPNEMKSSVIKINFRTFEVLEYCRKLGVEIDKEFSYIKYEDRLLKININNHNEEI